ncbi:hypothetical protein [Catellatospora tritici]|uniref:hypothetical protein n=1 Tax=Catellatospora tritici TaxID=2851566 RepID=UPI001C2DA606|nr:hypothetical protein [Catellatospora tritici]MBV1855063.1 hypothetical protein [Catellatospora tritici]
MPEAEEAAVKHLSEPHRRLPLGFVRTDMLGSGPWMPSSAGEIVGPGAEVSGR